MFWPVCVLARVNLTWLLANKLKKKEFFVTDGKKIKGQTLKIFTVSKPVEQKKNIKNKTKLKYFKNTIYSKGSNK